MKCLNKYCDADDISINDNFCYKCGEYTSNGYIFIRNKNNLETITNLDSEKKDNNFSLTISLVMITFIMFFIMCSIRGTNLFKPIFYLKRQIDSYIYGYSTSIIKTDNTYNKSNIKDIRDAKEIIKIDLNSQTWKCNHELKTIQYQKRIENNYSIPVVSFCDIDLEEVEKIKNVIDKMYSLFPNIDGALTNISITNSSTNKEYIARFQPMFQFVNNNEDIKKYNKVNKTQILLNSYYFLNKKILDNTASNIVKKNWYVKDSTIESTIAHEFGHYISFVILLRENDLDNITLVTPNNKDKIKEVLNQFDSGVLSKAIINQALNNYNDKYNTNLDLDSFALTISTYAGVKDKNNSLIADETIAEAIHDYYLHGENCAKSSYEIVNIIKNRLQGEL